MAAGADATTQTAAGSTALHDACRGGSFEIVQILLEHALSKGDIDVVSGDGNTALGEAARAGRVDICELLLKSGANIDAQTTSGNSPLHWASMWGASEVVSLLIEKGADPDVLNNAGKSVLDVVITVDEAAKEKVLNAYNEVLFYLALVFDLF